jgi:lipoprotein YgeR
MPYSTSEGGNKGIDIAARGTPVYASGAGKVVYVGNQLRGYGNLIMIKHGEDYITAYAHNDTMLVNNGQNVKAGQKIATMGSTGTDSVKLHFQIRYRRRPSIRSVIFRHRAANRSAK